MASRDGGVAFPRAGFASGGDDYTRDDGASGMSKREWYATYALQALIANQGMAFSPEAILRHAGIAFAYADAMIETAEED